MLAPPSPAETFEANRARGALALSVVPDPAGVTRRARLHESGALRLRFPNPVADECEAVLVNTAGGVAGGDRFAIDLSVETGARLVLTSAAAEKVYRSHGTDARIDLRLKVAAGAALRWLPQETILFDRAQLVRRIEVDLDSGAGLLMAEALVLGRAAMGERVDTGRLFDRWRVRRDGRLIFADGVRLDGEISAQLAPRAAAHGAGALASVLLAGDDAQVVASLRDLGDISPDWRGEVGVSAWNGLTLVRLIAADGAALRHDLMRVLAVCSDRPLPRLWLN